MDVSGCGQHLSCDRRVHRDSVRSTSLRRRADAVDMRRGWLLLRLNNELQEERGNFASLLASGPAPC